MFTEKTQGKIELLQDYLSGNYSEDKTLKTILDSILSDVSSQAKVIEHQVEKKMELKIVKPVVKNQIKKYPETIDLAQVNKGNFQNLVSKKLEEKKWDNSTILNKATYDKGSKILTVYEKRGITHEYSNIPVAVKESLFDSGKPGKTYHSYIQDKYKGKKVALAK